MTNFKHILKKYKLDDLLFLIGEVTRNMLKDNIAIQDIPWTRKFGCYKQYGYIKVTAWDLVDISYHAICNSNDYRSKSITNRDLIKIISEYRNYDNNLSGEKLDNLNKHDHLLYIFFGHSQKQFWYQNGKEIIIQFNRNIELLQYIPKQLKSTIAIDEVVKREVGLITEDFNKLLVLLFGIGFRNTDITEVQIDNKITEKNSALNRENLLKVINIYKATYKDYRESNLRENYLFVKPIVQTDTKRLLILNHYLLLKLLSDGLYWVVRNHFFKKKSQEFTNEFGIYFEKHLENVIEYYLDDSVYKNLQNNCNHKIADWVIETNKYVIIIEQKSAIASLKLKTIYPDINGIRNYLNKFAEAFDQLNETENELGYNQYCKKTIKLIVHFENLYVQELLKEEILKSMNKSLESEKATFFISISDLEMLINILSKNEEIFDQIIEEKLKLEYDNSIEGKGFDLIISKYIEFDNDYFLKYRNHFDKLVNKLK